MSAAPRPLVLGRIAGHRGRSGELTVRVISGDAGRWTGLTRVLTLPEPDAGSVNEEFIVESARSYRDRLVLKLSGIDDAESASALRGRSVAVPEDEMPELPDGRFWLDRLLGLRVVDTSDGAVLGVVLDVIEVPGSEVLVVGSPRDERSSDDEGEVLIPLVREFVVEVDERDIRVRIPEGLRDLNRREDG